MSAGYTQNPSMPMSASLPTVSPPRGGEFKAPGAFRTISEVATDLEVPQHVLRFWESKFDKVRPLKRGGGRRYYRPEDVQLLSSIKDLLYNQGFTIRGVQKLLREGTRGAAPRAAAPVTTEGHTASTVTAVPQPVMAPPAQQRWLSAEKRREVEGVLIELKALRELLRQSGI